LIILDMHMPISEGKSVVENDAGIKVLHLLNVLTGMHLRDRRCPIVVYTAYPSFADCFQCAQAGAAAYVSKVITELPEGKVEGGPQQLVQVCQRLLSPVEREQPRGISTAFSDEWGRINGLWLRKNYGRKWAAFVRTAVAQKAAQEHTWLADRSKYPERDGVVVLLGDTYEEVVTLVLSSPALYQDVPPIIRIPSPEPTGTEVRL
jgi:CheY-like chemotaxis protein